MLAPVTQGLLWYGLMAVYAILVALSVLSLAIIAERVWFFVRARIDFPHFLQRVGAVIDDADWEGAWDLAQGSKASPCVVLKTGVELLTGSQADRGSAREVINAIRSAEGLRLEGKAPLLRAIGETALYLGALGIVLALLARSGPVAAAAPTTVDLWFLAPAALGFLVAIPAWLAAHVFSWRAQQADQQMIVVAELLLAEITSLTKAPVMQPVKTPPGDNPTSRLPQTPRHAA
jgi:biopolymer transport protein ExbB/TolQ